MLADGVSVVAVSDSEPAGKGHFHVGCMNKAQVTAPGPSVRDT